ncbi:hypothetical protein NDU88_000002 [Pleurodeles waltl]|uniref:Uncharacterized protein n=1 Tax=Pleurodeles waltl TaxID=8319 RepID=A0AAV7KMG8_PLEWA|nr:hypothetical protein NDU88_000002 [Pleurodeles waltl]
MCGSSRNEPLRYGPPIGEEEEMLGGAVLLGGCLRGCPPPQLVQPYVTAYSWHGSRCVGLPLNSWPEESSGATRIDERGAPGAVIWFEQIGTGGKRIPPPPCFISALGTYGVDVASIDLVPLLKLYDAGSPELRTNRQWCGFGTRP